jgi:TatA/E family protein of Tat protein translocase
MPFNVGPVELIIVLVIALLVIGPRRLPEMGHAVGKTIREFRKASTDVTEATTIDFEEKPASSANATTAAATPPVVTPAPVAATAAAAGHATDAADQGPAAEPSSDDR